jgi:hypothetical protein
MKLQARITESVPTKKGTEPQSVIVEFVGDKSKQKFEVLFYDLDPYQHKLRKWDIWDLSIRWKSEIFTDEKTGNKSYFTYLICDKVSPVMEMPKKT